MSIYVVPVGATHIWGYVIEFSDGGEPLWTPMGFGTFAECDRCAQAMTAVSYSGDRPVKAGFAKTFPLDSFAATSAAAPPASPSGEPTND